MSQYSDFFGVSSGGGGETVPINGVQLFYHKTDIPGYSAPFLTTPNGEVFLKTGTSVTEVGGLNTNPLFVDYPDASYDQSDTAYAIFSGETRTLTNFTDTIQQGSTTFGGAEWNNNQGYFWVVRSNDNATVGLDADGSSTTSNQFTINPGFNYNMNYKRWGVSSNYKYVFTAPNGITWQQSGNPAPASSYVNAGLSGAEAFMPTHTVIYCRPFGGASPTLPYKTIDNSTFPNAGSITVVPHNRGFQGSRRSTSQSNFVASYGGTIFSSAPTTTYGNLTIFSIFYWETASTTNPTTDDSLVWAPEPGTNQIKEVGTEYSITMGSPQIRYGVYGNNSSGDALIATEQAYWIRLK